VDGATGRIQTQRVLSPASPFLKDGWYRAIILALDDGEQGARDKFGALTWICSS
jgi:cadherin 15 (M-cadherin)